MKPWKKKAIKNSKEIKVATRERLAKSLKTPDLRKSFTDKFLEELESKNVIIGFRHGLNLVAHDPEGVIDEEVEGYIDEYKMEILNVVMARYWERGNDFVN